MPSNNHLTYELLADFVEGRADASTAARVTAHLDAGCAACEAQRARLARLFSALQGRELVPAPLAATERVRQLFRDRLDLSPSPAAQGEPAKAGVSPAGLFARLIFDSRSLSGAAPAARGDALPSFNLLFRADGYDIDLWQEPQAVGDNWNLIGQALADDENPNVGKARNITGATLTPQNGENGAGAEASFPARGEFHFENVAPGLYTVSLAFAGEDASDDRVAEITLLDVPVGR